MKRPLIVNDCKGMALLITVSVIVVLIAVGVSLNRNMREAITTASRNRDRLRLMQMAKSGVHAAMAVLSEDRLKSTSDSVQEDWADSEKTNELIEFLNFEEGKVRIEITDELSKIQVNALVDFPRGREFNVSQMMLWNRFLENEFDEEALPEDGGAVAVLNAIKDWIDKGDDDAVTGLTGSESEYYRKLDPPYHCPNTPMLHIFELSHIKGISVDLFYGGEQGPGILHHSTVFGEIPNTGVYPGKININTATRPVLAALLPQQYSGQAQKLVEFREEKAGPNYIHDLSKTTWYKKVPGFNNADIDPKLITLSSDLFRIESTASLHAMKMKVTVVVRREKQGKSGKWYCRILSWNSF